MGKQGAIRQFTSTPLVFLDLETTGLIPLRERVIEVAAIRVEDGKVTNTVRSLINPATDVPFPITTLTGITTADVQKAPYFEAIADDLTAILDGAVMVAHNARFDYSFLKQEFKRLGKTFRPRQLCTMKLSRTLFPEYKAHSLQSIIQRYDLQYNQRHRAYDDARVLWEFLQFIQVNVAVEVVDAAIAAQLRSPSLPKGIAHDAVKNLPTGPGIYIFEDEVGRVLYVGKSINIRKRVMQHFGADHSDRKEFKISQGVQRIRYEETDGELAALLLESQRVKELQPLYNRMLRKTDKLVIMRQQTDDRGYIRIVMEEARMSELQATGDILATYPRRGQAKESLHEMRKDFQLCPKLLGLEKAGGACFSYQLRKCRGACGGHETAESYNQRLLDAFGRRRLQAWPFDGAVMIREFFGSDGFVAESSEAFDSEPLPGTGFIVDQWRVLAQVRQQPDRAPEVVSRGKVFDLDTYKILQLFLATKMQKLHVRLLRPAELKSLGM